MASRSNVILLGDNVGDDEMADGVPNTQVVLKIGFIWDRVSEPISSISNRNSASSNTVALNSFLSLLVSLTDLCSWKLAEWRCETCVILCSQDDLLPSFLEHFDIVLMDDQSMDLPNAIVRACIEHHRKN